MLYELPVILFNEFTKKQGIKMESIKEFLYFPENYVDGCICKYVSFPMFSKDEVPTLVLLDLRHVISIEAVKVFILQKPPKIENNNKVRERMNFVTCIEVIQRKWSDMQMHSDSWKMFISLGVNIIYRFGVTNIGNIFNGYSNMYSLDLVKMTNELFNNSKYNWVTKYHSFG